MSRLVFHQQWCLKHSGCPCSYKDNLNLIAKVLDFDPLGGPILTVGRTVFEMWLGAL